MFSEENNFNMKHYWIRSEVKKVDIKIGADNHRDYS